jgi:MFS family permease
MECDVYYSSHPPFTGAGNRCNLPEINARTAQQVSYLGMSTSFFGVLNLFVCGWFMKLWGPRWAFVSQTALLGLRVSTQVIAVTLGGRVGIIMFQATQAIGIVGGPAGYQLVVNTAISETVSAEKRTLVFGRLQGAIMLGTAFGFLLGGILGDAFSIRRPFETAFFLYVASTIYGALFMPTLPPEVLKQRQSKGIKGFFAPLRIISPRNYRLESGKIVRNHGLVTLAVGIFLGVLASGYAPILLQMYATSAFNFGTTENGALMFGNALIRGLFLILVFPRVISSGRAWFSGTNRKPPSSEEVIIPTEPEEFEVPAGQDAPLEPVNPPGTKDEADGIEFDLLFVRWSLLVDSVVTAIAGFSTQGWQAYMGECLWPRQSVCFVY